MIHNYSIHTIGRLLRHKTLALVSVGGVALALSILWAVSGHTGPGKSHHPAEIRKNDLPEKSGDFRPAYNNQDKLRI